MNILREVMFIFYRGILWKEQDNRMSRTTFHNNKQTDCGSPPGVMMADTLSFNAKIGVVDFWV